MAELIARETTAVPSQPLFVIGSPRSGTTFFVQMLNCHPAIYITNETRIFVLLKDMIEIRGRHPWLIERPYQEQFATFARRHVGAWVEQFYREELKITRPIWGDKHPHYADPTVLQGEAARVTGASSGSCLRLIRDCLPKAKFIHLHRDPRHVAWSLLRKGWVSTLGDGAQVWRRHVEEIDAFFSELQPEQRLSLPYSALLLAPEEAVAQLLSFLGVADSETLLGYLAEQRRQPTPLSGPMSNIAEPTLPGITDKEASRILERSGPSAMRLGYEASSPV